MAEAAESGTVTLPERPVHTLDVLASMIRYSGVVEPGELAAGEGAEPSVLDEVMAKAHDLSVVIRQPGNWDELSGLLVQEDEYEDWRTRFSSEEQARALGFIGVISDFVTDVRERVTPEIAAVAFPNDIGTAATPEQFEELRVLEQELRGKEAVTIARRVFERFSGGPVSVYREALLASSQAMAEDHSGHALVTATEHIRAVIAQEKAAAAEAEAKVVTDE